MGNSIKTEPPLADDLLTGAAAIAVFMFGTEEERRRVYWLADTGQLPVSKSGRPCARGKAKSSSR